jgi:hypothetical protein
MGESGKSDGKAEVTVCTVVTPMHKRLAALNRRLEDHLNPGVETRWIVVHNPDVHLGASRERALLAQAGAAKGLSKEARQERLQAEIAKRFDPEPIEALIPDAQVIPGPSLQDTFERVFAETAAVQPDAVERRRLLEKYLASYHHAEALSLALARVTTRYAVVVDPDFYVVRPDWIAAALARMDEAGLAAFGAPWSPRWYQKFRGFPCTHLMVLDLERRPWSRDMLAPDLVGGGRRYASPVWTDYPRARARGRASAAAYLLRHAFAAVSEGLRQRASIGASRDTGYRLALDFARDPALKAETLTPVFAPQDGFMPAAVAGPQLSGPLEALAPDRWRYLPRGADRPSREGFKDKGYPDFRARGWEEFLWRGEPFAFHVRGEMRREPLGGVDAGELLEGLNAVLAKLGRPPLDRSRTDCRQTDA